MTSKSLDLLKKHEGLRLTPYKDSVGLLTVGYGHLLDQPITQQQADLYLDEDYENAMHDCERLSWFDDLDEARAGVVVNMVFNLGLAGFRGFKKTIHLIEMGMYEDAADEMKDSRWADQVGTRADELSEIMRTGEWP